MKTLPPQTRTVALTLILFFASSFILPLFNQSILSGIVSPSIFFITWIQCLGTVIITLLVAKLFNKQNKHDLPLVFPKFNKKQMFQMLPSSACFCCLLVFQNYSFQNDKSLLMMVARTTSVLGYFIFALIIFRELPTIWVFLSCFIIMIGSALLSIDSVEWSPNGLVIGIITPFVMGLFMKFLLIALLVVAAFCEPLTEDNYNFLFSKFQEQYNRNYRPEEQALRFSLFKNNLDRIRSHNARTDVSFKTGINQFSDWTRDEYLSILPNMPLQYSDAPVWDNEQQPTAATVDWRQKGAVTPVKDQGQCGSCWSFSTTGTMEGRDFIDTGVLNSYSESMIVDCDGDCYGCNGCWPYLALEWVQNQGGDCAEKDYPYHAVQETCKKSQCKKKGTCKGHTNIKAGSESALATAVEQNGPISVAIDASHWSFQQYKSGVYYEPDCSSSQLDHAVLCVGYGVQDNANYWIVKNSWNTSWGNEGYIYMAKDRSNNCGIATSAVYPNTCSNL